MIPGGLASPLLSNGGLQSFSFVAVDADNADFRTLAMAAGWDGVTPAILTGTIPDGVTIGSSSTDASAFTVTGSFPSGTELFLNNAGEILGRGGNGGRGGNYNANGSAGGAGGRALFVDGIDITIDNSGGLIGGGGGGGGGGAGDGKGDGGGGGGGGRGSVDSAGGNGGTRNSVNNGGTGIAGTAGTASSAGTGGVDGVSANAVNGGHGGNGGDFGANGSNGQAGESGSASSGGAAGPAVGGNSTITWTNTGTRTGAVA